jgi:hypothetical protein
VTSVVVRISCEIFILLAWDFMVGPCLCSFHLWISCLQFQRCCFMLACFARPCKLLSAEPILVLPLVLHSWDSVRFVSSCGEHRRRFGFWSRPNLSQDSFFGQFTALVPRSRPGLWFLCACRATSARLVFLLRLPNYRSCVICSPARFCHLVFSF